MIYLLLFLQLFNWSSSRDGQYFRNINTYVLMSILMFLCQYLCSYVNTYVPLSILMFLCQYLCSYGNTYVLLSILMFLCQYSCFYVNTYVLLSILMSIVVNTMFLFGFLSDSRLVSSALRHRSKSLLKGTKDIRDGWLFVDPRQCPCRYSLIGGAYCHRTISTRTVIWTAKLVPMIGQLLTETSFSS